MNFRNLEAGVSELRIAQMNNRTDLMMSLSDPIVITLTEDLTIQAASDLKADLLKNKDSVVQIDAASVKHIDAPCAQILAAFALHQKQSNKSIEFVKESKAFREGLSTLGLDSILPVFAG